MVIRAALVGVCAIAYAAYGLLRHRAFGSSAYDLGLYDQFIWRLSRFEIPSNTVRDLPNMFGDHFDPILYLLAPAYWVVPGPETLIVAQAVLFALSTIPVAMFLRRRLPEGPALTLTAAYALFWGLQRAAAFDFHDYAFAPLLIATAILAIDTRRWALLWVACGLMVITKEDLIPVLTFLGLYLVVLGERRRGIALAAASVIVFAIVVRAVIPSFNEAHEFSYASSYGDIMRQPWRLPLMLVTPVAKLKTAGLWLAPFLFLPLLSPLALLFTPFVLSRFLSATPHHWSALYHYSAPLAPILVMSAGDALMRLHLRPRIVNALAAACLVVCAIVPGNQPVWDLLQAKSYALSPAQRAGYRALAQIPSDRSVQAQAAVVPHLSRREQIYVLGFRAPVVDYVITAEALSPWPLPGVADVRTLTDEWRQKGYREIFAEEGWVVLQRP